MQLKPQTKFGKWSVWLNAFFLIIIAISIILVNVLGVLSFDDYWWDVTVPILALATITAFILGIIAIIKKERSVLVYISVIVGLLVILFIPLHSLFIND
jgi:hypothetical protein